MPEINQLTAVDEVFAGDAVPIYSASNGDARKASLTVIRDFIQDNLDLNVDLTHQYAAPSATGFTVTLTDNGESKWLIMTPDADYAAGTIVFPSVANAVDDQEILITTTKAVNTLTLNGNGSTVVGGPTNLNANTSVRFRYDTVFDRWYAVGTDVNEVANSLKSSATTGVMKITGPAAGSTRTMTIPDADATLLTTNAAVTVAQGGTGANTLTVNNVLLGNGTSALQVVAPSTSGNVLTSNGTTWVSSAPGNSAGVKSNSTTGIMQITGPAAGQTRVMTIPDANATLLTTNATVTVGQGGTGAATFTANSVLLGNGTSALQVVAPGSNGAVLQSNGTTWLAGAIIASAEWTPTATIVTNLDAVTIGKCRYQRIGSIVFVSGIVNLDLTADGTITFRLTLPIASNFAATTDASGCACLDITGVGYANLRINADTTNDALYFTGNADSGPFDMAFSAAYTII